MEVLFQSFLEIPVKAVGMQGLIQSILILGVLMLKLKIPKPQKKMIKK
jgi:hypothetical protein